jgi:hypothetical protein
MEQETRNDQQAPTTGQSSSSQSAGESPTIEQDLLAELNRLGNNFVDVVKVAWNSEQRKQIEEDLRVGLSSLATNLEDGFKQVSKSQQAQELLNKAEDVAGSVAEKVRKSELAQELGAGLLKGLRTLSEQLDKLITEIQSKKGAESSAAPSSASGEQTQDIPIQKQGE